MAFPFRMPIALAAALFALGVHAQAQVPAAEEEEDESPPPAAAAPGPRANLPQQELTEPMLYEFLLGEIAAQRGSPGLAAQTYLDLAKRTRDPRIARRAVEIANFARAPEFALEAARLWHQADPASAQALRTLTTLLVGQRKLDEAEPYIAQILGADGSAAPGGLMQLAQLLAQSPDKALNLPAAGIVVLQVGKRKFARVTLA